MLTHKEKDSIRTRKTRTPSPVSPAANPTILISSDDNSDTPLVDSTRSTRSSKRRRDDAGSSYTPSGLTRRQTRSSNRQSTFGMSTPLAERKRSSGVLSANLSELASPETSDANEIVTPPARKVLRKSFVVDIQSNESDDNESLVSPTEKRRQNIDSGGAHRTPRQTSEQEQRELAEDLEDLKGSGTSILYSYLF